MNNTWRSLQNSCKGSDALTPESRQLEAALCAPEPKRVEVLHWGAPGAQGTDGNFLGAVLQRYNLCLEVQRSSQLYSRRYVEGPNLCESKLCDKVHRDLRNALAHEAVWLSKLS